MREHKFLSRNQGNLCVEEFDKTICLQSEKREERIQEMRGERLQGIVEGASSAPHLASSSAASIPGETSVLGPIVA